MAPKRSAEEDHADSGLAAKRMKTFHDAQSPDDGISLPISRSRSPAIAHERRFLCPVVGCASGANDAAGLRKHLKTQHEDDKTTKVLDDFSISWMSWARGDYASHPPTGQAKTTYLESSQAAQQPNQLIRLRLALKQVVPPSPSISDNEDAAGSDNSWQASGDQAPRKLAPPVITTIPYIQEPTSTTSSDRYQIIIVEVPPTPAAPTAPSANLPAAQDQDAQGEGLLTRRLRSSRNPTPLGSRASSRAPSRAPSRATSKAASRASSRARAARKPRKPTKESLLNGRLDFQKSRTWQKALSVGIEGLPRELGPEVIPTERERVFAKRIESDAVRIKELEAEVKRLKGLVNGV